MGILSFDSLSFSFVFLHFDKFFIDPGSIKSAGFLHKSNGSFFHSTEARIDSLKRKWGTKISMLDRRVAAGADLSRFKLPSQSHSLSDARFA